MSYLCPECKLLFSALPNTCPQCGGAVRSDTRLDRYYLADGFTRHTGNAQPTAAADAPQPKAAPSAAEKPAAAKAPKVRPEKPADEASKAAKEEPKTQPSEEDILSSLRKSYYSQHGKPKADTVKHESAETVAAPASSGTAKAPSSTAPAAADASSTAPAAEKKTVAAEKKAAPKKKAVSETNASAAETAVPTEKVTKKKVAAAPPPADGGFFSNPGPAPHIPQEAAAFEPLPTIEPIPSVEPLPTIEPEPMPRRGTGGYTARSTMANVPWRGLFRVFFFLLIIGGIAALIINLPTILAAAADVAVTLLPSILLVGGMIYLLRCLFRGGK